MSLARMASRAIVGPSAEWRRRGGSDRVSPESVTSSAVDAVQHLGHLDQTFARRVEAYAPRQARDPVGRRTAAPGLGRLGQGFALRAREALGGEVVERAAHVAQFGAAVRA